MALDKAIDSAQLDENLTAVADAIRAKGATSGAMAFPDGFVEAVGAIQAGGSDPYEKLIEFLNGSITNLDVTVSSVNSITSIKGNLILRGIEKLYSGKVDYLSAARVYFPDVTWCQYNVLRFCSFEYLRMPKVTEIGANSTMDNKKVKKVDMGALTGICSQFFYNCTSLETLIIRTPTLCTNNGHANNLVNTPIANGTGCIYVPSALLEEYKTATNWSAYADQFRAIEDYPEETSIPEEVNDD